MSEQATKRELGLIELVAISVGGMIGGGIFSILGIAVERLGNAAPVAIAAGGLLALLAGFSYAQLASYYQDEGATYAFFKRTFTDSHVAAAIVGWLVVFGYIATLALYSFTFASYVASLIPELPAGPMRAGISAGVLGLFATLNIVSVRLMGQVEDLMVYIKLAALALLIGVLFYAGDLESATPVPLGSDNLSTILLVAALTFVAFEGFQLSISAYEEAIEPLKNVPRAIYISILIAVFVYVLMAEGSLWALDKGEIVANKEFALAAGAEAVLGKAGYALVIASALLATASAISGTLFGASRLAAVIADDKLLPQALTRRVHGHVPAVGIVTLAVLAWVLVLSGGLELIVEFGSLVFLVVSLLMALSNWKVREHTHTALWACVLSVALLGAASLTILWFQYTTHPVNLAVTLAVGAALTVGAGIFARRAAHAA